MCNPVKHEDMTVTALYCQAISYLITSGMMVGRTGNRNVTHLDVVQSRAFYKETMEAAKGPRQGYLTKEELTAMLRPDTSRPGVKLATLLVSTKIAWWLTNHHVGQEPGQIKSYCGKVVRLDAALTASDVDKYELRNAIWALGKYCVTIPVLRALGVGDLIDITDVNYPKREVPLKELTFSGAEDVKLRMVARPAGTADPCTYLAIARMAGASMFSVLLPAIAKYDEIVKIEEDIKAQPARYHMGAQFLTGRARIESHRNQFTEEQKDQLAAFVYAIAPHGNLAKAEVIPSLALVQGTTVYTLITSVKKDLIGMATDAFLCKLVSRAAPGIESGGFAKQVGLITETSIAEAKAEVEEAKEKAAQEAGRKVSST
jgi:hypothetical protein